MPQYQSVAVIDDITIMNGRIEKANIKADPFCDNSYGKAPPPR